MTAFERSLEAKPGNQPCVIHFRFVPSSRDEDRKAAVDGPKVPLLSAMEAPAAGSRGAEVARALEQVARDADVLLETRQMPAAIAADGAAEGSAVRALGDVGKAGGRKQSEMMMQ